MELETLANELKLAMKGHDWYYDRSDDPFWYRKGRAQYERMTYAFAGLDKVDEKYAVQIWNENAPEGFRFKNKV